LSKSEEDPPLARTEPQSPKKPKNSEVVSPAHENDSQNWSKPDQGDHPGPDGSLKEIDKQADPPVDASPLALKMCSYERLSSLIIREHEARSDEGLRKGVREVLREMETCDLLDVPEREAADQKFLDEVKEHILDAEQFVAGSFKNNLAAWEELLKDSKRQSSRKVLKWIKEGVQPTFEVTQNADPKKVNRVRSLLRRAVPKDKVESFLEGKMPHEIEMKNHQLVYEHLPFVVKAVQNLVITSAAHLYGPKDGKPKVVNPPGVALNGATERLVLNRMYINLFMKSLSFRYKRLRDMLTFLQKAGFVSS
jgi:hypothetical protein